MWPPGFTVTRRGAPLLLPLWLAAACGGTDAQGPGAGGATGSASGGQDGGAGASGGVGGVGGGSGAGGADAGSDRASGPGGGAGSGRDVGGAPADTQGPAGPDAEPGGETGAMAACSVCTSWGAPQALGKVAAGDLNALSGMAASWRNPGVIYVHNDHDQPVIYALGENAGLLARVTLSGVVGHDIEDMEVSRCPAGTCLFAADIGNNLSPRTEFGIFRASEPAIAQGDVERALTVPAERFAFRYGDAPHNAESLIIDPTTGAVYIVTKVAAGQPSAVYHLETFDLGKVNLAVKIADLPVPAPGDQPATAGTAQPCGAGFLLRTGNTLYEFRIPVGTPFADAFHVTPIKVPAAVEQQSEAVTYQPDGRGYYTTSEGATPPLDRVSCR